MKKQATILCVDDLSANLRIRCEMLKLIGYRTVLASDHRSALQAVTEQDIDLAVIDYHLAGEENGEQLANDLRVLHPNMPLIMLSGDPKVPESARRCVDAFLLKGVSSPSELRDLIATLLRQRANPTIK